MDKTTATVLKFNGVLYFMKYIRQMAKQANVIEIKREEAVVAGDEDYSRIVLDYNAGEEQEYLEQNKQPIAIVYSFEGKYFFLQGGLQAAEKFKTVTTVKARLVSRIMIKRAMVEQARASSAPARATIGSGATIKGDFSRFREEARPSSTPVRKPYKAAYSGGSTRSKA